ncbi:MAG: rod-binding protein [Devosiaceae bacterium]|nr:rod-binding protein [Devosiaceae bacterium MH13]
MIDSIASSTLGPTGASLESLASSLVGSDNTAIDQAAEEFEAVMLTAMLKPMFEGIETPEPFGGGSGERMWQGLLVEQYAAEIAATGGIGIADAVRAELIRIQETAN